MLFLRFPFAFSYCGAFLHHSRRFQLVVYSRAPFSLRRILCFLNSVLFSSICGPLSLILEFFVQRISAVVCSWWNLFRRIFHTLVKYLFVNVCSSVSVVLHVPQKYSRTGATLVLNVPILIFVVLLTYCLLYTSRCV